MNDGPIRLPRLVEADPRGSQLIVDIARHRQPLWQEGDVSVPVAELGSELANALRSANHAGQLVRGLENAERTLTAEARGLDMADQRSDVPRGVRVSRLLVLASDGSERFYRRVEALMNLHGARVLAVRLDTDAAGLGEVLYGAGGRARLLMIERKETVTQVLLALADQWSR